MMEQVGLSTEAWNAVKEGIVYQGVGILLKAARELRWIEKDYYPFEWVPEHEI